MDSSPACVFLDLNKFNGFNRTKGLETAIHFAVRKLILLMHHNASRRAAAVPVMV